MIRNYLSLMPITSPLCSTVSAAVLLTAVVVVTLREFYLSVLVMTSQNFQFTTSKPASPLATPTLLPLAGADVGGFFGNPDAELMVRWYQLGAFYPFFRGHAHLETARREPWLFGEETTGRIRTAIRSRYALMPYLYTLFRHANLDGASSCITCTPEFLLSSCCDPDTTRALVSSNSVDPYTLPNFQECDCKQNVRLDYVTKRLHLMPRTNNWSRKHAAPAAAVLTSCRVSEQASR